MAEDPILAQLGQALQSLTGSMAKGERSLATMQLARTCAKLVGKMQEQLAGAQMKAVVTNVSETAANFITIGTRITIAEGAHISQLVGQSGLAINEVGDDGQVFVVFDDGQYGVFRATTTNGQPAEIETVPPTRRVTISFDSRYIAVPEPQGVHVVVGQSVWINPVTYHIIGLAEGYTTGQLMTVERVINGGRIEVNVAGQRHVAELAPGLIGVESGHRVLLDPTYRTVVENFGFDDGRFAPGVFRPVVWDQIGGYTELKRQMQDLVVEMFDPTVAGTIDSDERVRGILFHGPGGTGKTYMVRALYTAIRKLSQVQQADGNGFFNIEAAELHEGIVGETEKLIRRIVNRAVEFSTRTKLPAVIVLNEVDAIAKRRGTGISSDVNDTNVPMLLGMMDGFERYNILWVFVTNRLDVLDPELIRDGRIDRMFFVGRATQADAGEIIRIHLQRHPGAERNLDALTAATMSVLFDPKKVLYDLTLRGSDLKDEHQEFTLGHLACGALIENGIKQARELARRRFRSQEKTGSFELMNEDIEEAFTTIYQAKQSVNIDSDVRTFLGADGERLVSARRRLRQIMK